MTGAAKRKGDAAEREVATLIHAELGYNVRRALGAGRADDTGDLVGVPSHAIQVANWDDVARAAREKPLGAEVQRRNAGEPFAATFVRFRGGQYRVILLPQQWADLVREALA